MPQAPMYDEPFDALRNMIYDRYRIIDCVHT